jgi:NAD(P)-dependent dehydrogenase (short-subunit alcohol dehydrogenase family)
VAATFPSERTAIVTGAASPRGIGLATAHRLAAAGWSLAIIDLDSEAVQKVAADLSGQHDVSAIGVVADVTDADEIDAAVRRIEAELPPVVGLANIAGTSSPTEFLDVTGEEWDRVFAVNMRSVFLVTQRVLPGLLEREIGRIVSISSVSAQRGGGTYSKVPYSAAKAALIGFSRALAREVGAHGVTVNCVTPGPVDTDLMGGALDDARRASMSKDTLVGRVANVDEVGALLTYLMGPDAGYITAATYDINGGLHMS